MRWGAGLLAVGWMIFGLSWEAVADPPAYLELQLETKTQRGKLVAMDEANAWLMTREGKLNQLPVKDIKSFQRISPQFQPLSSAEVRDALRREFGQEFEVAGSGHYLVCAPRQKAGEYARLFDEIYREFHHYFSVRGFRSAPPEFPLVAIVFPDRKSFEDYCKADGFTASRDLMGYYFRSSNRVALFDPANKKTAFSTGENSALIAASIQASLADTIVHEATHQAAFNIGLHARIGKNPKWIVEGLATVFESPGIRDSAGQRGKAFGRINKDRYVWFRNFAQSRRKPKSLAAFLADDGMFQTATLDAYAQAWALSFYLIETRPSKYAKYLKTIASRDPMKDYPKEERLRDFKTAFGNDLDTLEIDFLRFISRLED